MAVRKNDKKKVRNRRNRAQLFSTLFLAAAIVFAALIIDQKPYNPVAVAESDRIVAEFDTIQVPVPTQLIEAGTRLGDISFAYIAFPVHQIPAGALLEISGLEDSRARVPLPARLPLFPENLTSRPVSGNAVIDKIPAGMRAITIRVDATTIVEGWAGSGAIIDVLLVENDRTTVVAEQVKILSAERSVRPVAGEVTPEVPSTVTLLVSQEQALAINTALPRGRITFALRSFQDELTWQERVYTSERFSKGSAGTAPPVVSGYLSFKGGKAFALANGKWVPTEVRPSGFFVASEEEPAT